MYSVKENTCNYLKSTHVTTPYVWLVICCFFLTLISAAGSSFVVSGIMFTCCSSTVETKQHLFSSAYYHTLLSTISLSVFSFTDWDLPPVSIWLLVLSFLWSHRKNFASPQMCLLHLSFIHHLSCLHPSTHIWLLVTCASCWWYYLSWISCLLLIKVQRGLLEHAYAMADGSQ